MPVRSPCLCDIPGKGFQKQAPVFQHSFSGTDADILCLAGKILILFSATCGIQEGRQGNGSCFFSIPVHRALRLQSSARSGNQRRYVRHGQK